MPQPPLQTAAVFRRRTRLAPPVTLPPLENHPHATHADQPALEVLEQGLVEPANYEKHLDVGE